MVNDRDTKLHLSIPLTTHSLYHSQPSFPFFNHVFSNPGHTQSNYICKKREDSLETRAVL